MADVTPWWREVELREEILESSGQVGDVQMSLHGVAHGTVGRQPPYANADYYGEITYPSDDLTALMATVAARLAGGDRARNLDALVRLDQGMGGGKSHGLVGLWHLANDPKAMAATEVGHKALAEAGRMVGRELPADLGGPQTVVLACDNMTATQPVAEVDGPARNLYERFLWRLVGGDRAMFDRYREHHANKAKITEALYAVNRPVLILVDEILNYVEQLSHSETADLAVEDMAFLRALCDAVNDIPGVVMLMVMISSEDDTIALDAQGEKRREDLEALLTRNGTTATVTSGGDFADILRRRLFKRAGTPEVIRATSDKFLAAMRGQWRDQVFDTLPRCGETDFHAQVQRSYPFHPLLTDMAETEWARMTGFQRVRSTIRIFAATIYAHQQRVAAGGWVPLLVGPGDLPLSDLTVRESVIGSGLIADRKAESNYRSLVEGDVVGLDDRSGAAREIDLAEESQDTNPRAAERAATALFLHSIVGSRKQGQQGATLAELQAAMFVPDASFTPTDAEMVLAALEDPDRGLSSRETRPGKGGRPQRWVMTTRHTLEMHYRQARITVDDRQRDERLARIADEAAKTGPFSDRVFAEADEDADPLQAIAEAGIDDARSNRLVVLDPRTYVFLNGIDEDTRRAAHAALGVGDAPMTVRWASSAVFAVVNTQRRSNARRAVTELIAWERVCDLDEVRADEDNFQQAKTRRDEVKRRAVDAAKGAYQHIVYLDESDVGGEVRDLRLDPSRESALDGTIVWKRLVENGKALDTAEFDAGALLHNLRDDDYGRPLNELRDLFWSTPRMPLLPDGDADLQRAIHQAVAQGRLRLVDENGQTLSVSRPGEIGLGQAGVSLQHPEEPTTDEGEEDGEPGGETLRTHPPGSVGIGGSSTGTGTATPETAEVQISLSVNKNLADTTARDAVFRLVRQLANAIDDETSTHLQATIKTVVTEEAAELIEQAARDAGINATRTSI